MKSGNPAGAEETQMRMRDIIVGTVILVVLVVVVGWVAVSVYQHENTSTGEATPAVASVAVG